MREATRHSSACCCGVGLLAVFAAASSAHVPDPGAPEWLPPTPREGEKFSVAIGERFQVALVAQSPGGSDSTVAITASGVPAGATFRATAGNPAGATVSWVPSRAHSGRRFFLTFTADPDDPRAEIVRRHVAVEVRAPARAFTLSSPATAVYRYAFVMRRVVARSAPNRNARPVGKLLRLTPERTTNLVLALDGRRTRRAVWIRVRLPVLPNDTTGWVPRRALSDWKVVRTHLVVDRRGLTATLYRLGTPVFLARVGIGRPSSPTPAGEFFVRNHLYGYNDPVYGPIAFGTSARSAVFTDWPGGGFIGIHGTNRPDLVPGRVSHGCIRLKNRDILRLAQLMPVGTPLTVR